VLCSGSRQRKGSGNPREAIPGPPVPALLPRSLSGPLPCSCPPAFQVPMKPEVTLFGRRWEGGSLEWGRTWGPKGTGIGVHMSSDWSSGEGLCKPHPHALY
jgi:hypothetical protein